MYLPINPDCILKTRRRCENSNHNAKLISSHNDKEVRFNKSSEKPRNVTSGGINHNKYKAAGYTLACGTCLGCLVFTLGKPEVFMKILRNETLTFAHKF